MLNWSDCERQNLLKTNTMKAGDPVKCCRSKRVYKVHFSLLRVALMGLMDTAKCLCMLRCNHYVVSGGEEEGGL